MLGAFRLGKEYYSLTDKTATGTALNGGCFSCVRSDLCATAPKEEDVCLNKE